MKVAHVRERHAPAGAPWRLAAALDGGEAPAQWLDLEVARRRAAAADPRLAHNAALYRQPLTTLDDHLARGPAGRGAARAGRGLRARGTTTTTPSSMPPTSPSVRRSSGRRRCATSTPSRATSGRCGSDVAARSPRPGTGCRSSTSATSRRCAARTIRSGRRRRRRSSTTSWRWPPWSTRRRATCRPSAAEEAIGGYTIFNDWSARDLQREETVVRLGPAKGKDFASSFGPWLVTPDELADARAGNGLRPRDDGRGQRHRDEPRPLVRRAVLVRRDARPGLGRRAACGPATWSAAGRSGPAACSRSATRRSAAISSPATRSSCASTDWAPSVTRSSREAA